jgi:hypothetical protein
LVEHSLWERVAAGSNPVTSISNNKDMDINDIPFIELDLDIDYSKLLSEYEEVQKRYEFKGYESGYFGVRKKYRESWSGIGLISSDGELYSAMTMVMSSPNFERRTSSI